MLISKIYVMKNLVICLLLLGLTSLGFSQNHSEIEEIHLEGVVMSNVNLNYLENVQDIALPEKIVSMQNEASVFDVMKLVEFDGRKESFKVKFKTTTGHIIADYNRNGKIIKTSERYKEIALPKDLIKAVLNQYPKSTFLKVAYAVDYDDQKMVEKAYKVQIMKDGKKRNLKIKSGGILNNALTTNSKK